MQGPNPNLLVNLVKLNFAGYHLLVRMSPHRHVSASSV